MGIYKSEHNEEKEKALEAGAAWPYRTTTRLSSRPRTVNKPGDKDGGHHEEEDTDKPDDSEDGQDDEEDTVKPDARDDAEKEDREEVGTELFDNAAANVAANKESISANADSVSFDNKSISTDDDSISTNSASISTNFLYFAFYTNLHFFNLLLFFFLFCS